MYDTNRHFLQGCASLFNAFVETPPFEGKTAPPLFPFEWLHPTRAREKTSAVLSLFHPGIKIEQKGHSLCKYGSIFFCVGGYGFCLRASAGVQYDTVVPITLAEQAGALPARGIQAVKNRTTHGLRAKNESKTKTC